jgi:hypothetical protein
MTRELPAKLPVGSYPPNDPVHIVGNQKRSVGHNGKTNRPACTLSLCPDVEIARIADDFIS